MKIIATCRALNEAKNVERFVAAHKPFVDDILIADGGSRDNTVALAEAAGAQVRIFPEMVQCTPDGRRNPHGRHINFVVNWALEEGADWVIFDDCDDVPTIALQQQAREIFETTKFSHVNVFRMYVYGEKHYYPKLNEPGQSIWAWRREANVRAEEENPLVSKMLNILPPSGMLMLNHPLACLHYSWPTEEEIARKIGFYISTGEGAMLTHPGSWAGPMVALPEWAVWK